MKTRRRISMIKVDMEMPRNCANCPCIMVIKETMFYPKYLCRITWGKLDREDVLMIRPEHCPMKEEEKK